jgi:hypothetical protein
MTAWTEDMGLIMGDNVIMVNNVIMYVNRTWVMA